MGVITKKKQQSKTYYVVNCFSVQINNTIQVKGIENEDKTLSFPDNPTWTDAQKLRAYKFINWKQINELGMKPKGFYFDNEEVAKGFCKAFYQNAIFQMKKMLQNKDLKAHKEGFNKAISDLEKIVDNTFSFPLWDMGYFEYAAMIEKAKGQNAPPRPVKLTDKK